MLFLKKISFLFLPVFLGLNLMHQTGMAQIDVNVMSFNIRLDTESDGENRWDKRKEQVAGLIKYYAPDFVGGQEVMHHQLEFLLKNLPEYAHIGVGRDDGKQGGEYSPVMYNKEKFELVQGGTFWLSPTPDSVSFGWDAVCRRVCSYGIFKEKLTGQHLFVLNTHFDHVGEIARGASARLILQKITEINTRNFPVILTGDFNATEEKEPIRFLKSMLRNAREASMTDPFGRADTWNGFEFDKEPRGCIDYIFVDKAKQLEVTKFITITHNYDLKYPSDHFPVMASLHIAK